MIIADFPFMSNKKGPNLNVTMLKVRLRIKKTKVNATDHLSLRKNKNLKTRFFVRLTKNVRKIEFKIKWTEDIVACILNLLGRRVLKNIH